jgi:hypothetical protein
MPRRLMSERMVTTADGIFAGVGLDGVAPCCAAKIG